MELKRRNTEALVSLGKNLETSASVFLHIYVFHMFHMTLNFYKCTKLAKSNNCFKLEISESTRETRYKI